jgi:hypothetical protein
LSNPTANTLGTNTQDTKNVAKLETVEEERKKEKKEFIKPVSK